MNDSSWEDSLVNVFGRCSAQTSYVCTGSWSVVGVNEAVVGVRE